MIKNIELGPFQKQCDMYQAIAAWMQNHEGWVAKNIDYSIDPKFAYSCVITAEYAVGVFDEDAGDPEYITTNAFWQCSCSYDMIHPATETVCLICHRQMTDGNNAQVRDVLDYAPIKERELKDPEEKANWAELVREVMKNRPVHKRGRRIVEIVCDDSFKSDDLLDVNGVLFIRDRMEPGTCLTPVPLAPGEDWDDVIREDD